MMYDVAYSYSFVAFNQKYINHLIAASQSIVENNRVH